MEKPITNRLLGKSPPLLAHPHHAICATRRRYKLEKVRRVMYGAREKAAYFTRKDTK